jgi:hypothetical protein
MNNNKLIVVIISGLIIVGGLFAYLIAIDRKISKMEKETKN